MCFIGMVGGEGGAREGGGGGSREGGERCERCRPRLLSVRAPLMSGAKRVSVMCSLTGLAGGQERGQSSRRGTYHPVRRI